MQAGRGTSRTRGTKKNSGCRACALAACCNCCENWCHICGVAKCRPARATRWQEDTLSTQYKRDYPPKHSDVERRIPGHPPLPSMPFSGLTTNQADYTPKHGRSKSARPADKPIPAHLLDDETTYKTHYPPKRADLEVPPKPVEHAWTAPFLGQSTYNADYIKRRAMPWKGAAPPKPPAVPLEGTTEYHDQYPRKPMPPREPRKAQALLPSSHVPTVTTYGYDYVPKPFEERERLHCCDDPRHPGQKQWALRSVDRPWSACSGGMCCRPKVTKRLG